MEIERKFEVNRLPEDIDSYSFCIIEQAYLVTEPEIRVRKKDEKFYITYKRAGISDLEREEYELPLNKKAYDTLRSKAEGNVILKKRMLIPYDNHTIELDIFDEPFAPLVLAEVEFESLEAANEFKAPEWFGEDVTNDKRYRNSEMSRWEFD